MLACGLFVSVLPSPVFLLTPASTFHLFSCRQAWTHHSCGGFTALWAPGFWPMPFLELLEHVFGSMSSHQRLPESSDSDFFVGDPLANQSVPNQSVPAPKTDQIAQEIGKLIPLVNDSLQPISRPSAGPTTANLASHLTWDDDGELAID